VSAWIGYLNDKAGGKLEDRLVGSDKELLESFSSGYATLDEMSALQEVLKTEKDKMIAERHSHAATKTASGNPEKTRADKGKTARSKQNDHLRKVAVETSPLANNHRPVDGSGRAGPMSVEQTGLRDDVGRRQAQARKRSLAGGKPEAMAGVASDPVTRYPENSADAVSRTGPKEFVLPISIGLRSALNEKVMAFSASVSEYAPNRLDRYRSGRNPDNQPQYPAFRP
jgi:hypothetical protein